jgi:hypothetical protein
VVACACHLPGAHWLYTYGPYAFLGASAALSAIVAPRTIRRIGARRHAKHAARMGLDPSELPAFKPSPTLAVSGLAGTLVVLWGIGTLACFLVLSVAREGPLEPGESLPGATLDAYVIAHMAPPLSNRAATMMIRRLDAGADILRYDPGSPLEARLGHAAALDPHPDDAVSRWARHHFRTRAGKVALANPSVAACSIGFEAFADALREGAALQLAQACRNVKGDPGARAAFKIGDFRNASGPETEAILSRLPFAPPSEPSCFAGGDATPPAELPLCRLLHAEVKKEARAEILGSLEVEPVYARRWLDAMRMTRGAALLERDRFAIDPALLVSSPLAAIADEPVAVYLETSAERLEKLGAADAASIEVTVAAHRSAFGDHGPAKQRCEKATGIAAGLSMEQSEAIQRICAAISYRGGEADEALEEIDPAASERFEVDELLELDGPALARALSSKTGRDVVRRGGLQMLLRGRAGDPALAEWLREGFPSCGRCDFHDQLEMLLLRRDAAQLLGDSAVLEDLGPILGRYRGVFENRPLGLILRAGRAE